MNMNCPYCNVLFVLEGVNPEYKPINFFGGMAIPVRFTETRPTSSKMLVAHLCPNCGKEIIWMKCKEMTAIGDSTTGEKEDYCLLYPKSNNSFISDDVPEKYSKTYQEASDILEISPRASAALSRRCLQQLIREQEAIEKNTLFEEIKFLISRNKLPQYLNNELDSIRKIGNFAAHPIKDKNTGEIIDVEAGEAEWTLETLKKLLQFYFVDSIKSKKGLQDLEEKMKRSK
jgi:hypothetical protein